MAAVRPRHVPGRVRAITRADLPALVALYVRVFGAPPGGLDAASAYLERLLFDHPWVDGELPSLVFEASDGEPAGLLGVMPRPMLLHGQRLRLAIGHHFMVAPEARAALASVQLMRAFLAGPQDIATLEACTPWRKLWEALGGSVALVPGLRWTSVIGPCRFAVGLATGRWRQAAWLEGAARLGDRVAARVVPRLRRPGEACDLTADPLVPDHLTAVHGEASRRATLAALNRSSACWLLDHLAAKTARGRLEGVLLRSKAGVVVGWYLYYAKPRGLSQVVVFDAAPAFGEAAFSHMLAHAHDRGCGALAGQVDRSLLEVVSAAPVWAYQPADSWQLVHGRRPELLSDVHAGRLPLSRLESDWWLSY